MSVKDDYIELFSYIQETLSSNKIMPNTPAPDNIKTKFEYHFEFDFIDGERKQPNFVFSFKNKSDNRQTKLIFGLTKLLNSAKYAEFRKSFLDNFSGILITKKNFFKTTNVPFVVIVVAENNKNKYFSSIDNASDLYNVIFDQEHHDRKIFYSTEIDCNNLLPEHYNPENKKIYDFIDNFQPQKLEDIAEIIPGKQPNSWEINETDGIPLLSAGSIKDGEIVKCTKFVNTDAISNYSRQVLEEGDILISRVFGQNKICVVKEKNLPAIASGFLFIVRPLNIIDIDIYKYLTSNTGQLLFKKQLSDISTGSTIQNISITDLRNLQIPSVNKDTINTFEKKYNSSFEEIKAIANKAFSCIQESVLEETIISNLIKAGWSTKDISKEERLQYDDKSFLIPDITLKDNGKILAFIEVKQSSLNITLKIQQIKEIQKKYNALAIISLGDYFEVYKKAGEQFIVYKYSSAPTKNELINIIKEEN